MLQRVHSLFTCYCGLGPLLAHSVVHGEDEDEEVRKAVIGFA